MKKTIRKKLFLSSVLGIGLLFILFIQANIFASHSARLSLPLMLQTNCGDLEVVPTPSYGFFDDDVEVSINIDNNQCQMSAFGFDLFYETSMFSYQGIEIQNCLTADWSTVDADEVSPGQVRIGGFAGSGTTIEASDNGCLVIVKFKVVGQYPDCSDGQQSTITINAYTDELASYEPQPARGTFTFNYCSGDISLPANKAGTWGNIIHFPVKIANNDEEICDFAFDFVFDSSVFEFKQAVKTSAIQTWSTLNWSQTSAGKIHVYGAMGSGACIPASTTANLVIMRMLVKCVEYAQNTPIPIRIEAYQNGISYMFPRIFETDFLYRPCPRLGDVNGDGMVTPGDAQKAFEIYLGRLTPTLNQLTVSDANCSCPLNSLEHVAQNNCTTPGDAQSIFEHYLGRTLLPLCSADYQSSTSTVQIQGDMEVNIPLFEDREVYALPTIGFSGKRLMVPVMANKPDGIHNFSLEMFYPQDLLAFEGVLASPLTKGFEYLGGEEVVPGMIRIEGQGEMGIFGKEPGSLCVAVFLAKEGLIGSASIILNSLSGDIRCSDAESHIFVRPEPLRGEENRVTLGRGVEHGGVLVVPVKVTDSLGMKAFGLEIKYSSDKMTFVGIQRTALTEDFVAVDGNDLGAGLLRVGGYSMSGIEDFNEGVLVELLFQVDEPGGEIEIMDTFDDLKGFDNYFYPPYHPKR